MARIKSLIRRNQCTILYHAILLVFVFVVISNYGDITNVAKCRLFYQRRDVNTREDNLDTNPSMPLVDHVEKSLDELNSDVRDPGEGVEGVAQGRPRDNATSPVQENAELLGEGGSPENDFGKFKDNRQLPYDLHDIHAQILQNIPMIPRVNRVEAVPRVRPQRKPYEAVKHHFRKKAEGVVHGPAMPEREMTKRANVLIIAAMRTGSSFLGELFQQRGDFFYMFEPGMQIMHRLDSLNLTRRVIYTKLIEMLQDFYRCDFASVPFFVDELNRTTLFARKQMIPALVSPQFCRKRMPGERPRDACQDVSVKVLETACRTKDHTAVKSIRVLDINLMISAVKDPDLNLKLIHLIRDPRSMILSRLKLNFPAVKVFNVTELSDVYRNILLKYCSSWLQNYEIGHYVPLMRKNYLMVRYEDLALEPYAYTKRIYDFVGVGAEIPPSMQTWLDTNTNVNDPSQKKAAAFSTKRDSKEVLVSWKSRLTLEMAQAIEEVGDCSRLMKATGYKLIGNDFEMLSNSDHLVDTFPVPELDINAFDFL
nr:carbohydrate sulfotransferase 4-like [Lytechinus pictus]